MFKKVSALCLIGCLSLSIIACTKEPAKVVDTVETVEQSVEQEVEQEVAITGMETNDDSLSDKLSSHFMGSIADYDNTSDYFVNIAIALQERGIVPFEVAAMSVEEGYLVGFDNTEIKGFTNGIQFGPMISTIPFIGFMFEVDETMDVDTFISVLNANANLRWNICTSADEITCVTHENIVMFVMHPATIDIE